MSILVWALIGIIGLAGCGLLLGLIYSNGYDRGCARGRQEERRIVSRWMANLRHQSAAAQRDIDYLYERARGQIRDLDQD